MDMGRNATTSTLHAASVQSGSLRTTIPKWIVDHFQLQAGDGVHWKFHVENGEIVVVMTPISQKEEETYDAISDD